MTIEGLLYGYYGYLVGSVPTFIFGVPYLLPSRGYIPIDVSALPTPSMSGS